MKRHKTSYRGVYFREADRLGGPGKRVMTKTEIMSDGSLKINPEAWEVGKEKVFYIIFKKDGKVHEEKVGRQYADDMTPARAARIRGERIEGKRLSRKQIREQREAAKKA